MAKTAGSPKTGSGARVGTGPRTPSDTNMNLVGKVAGGKVDEGVPSYKKGKL